MSVLPRLLLSLLFLVLSCSREHLRGQEQVCEKCNGTGYLEAEPCPTHKALRLPIAERGMQLMWGSTETCCNLTGTKPCLACATKKRTAENEEDRRLDHHYYYAWRSGNAVSVDSLGNVLRKMGTGYLVGCTDRFLVVANPPVGQFTKAEYAALEPELKDASEKFPGLVKLQTNTVTPEEMTLLYLLRCEDLYQKFWKLLAKEDAPDFMLYHKGHEGELYVTPTRRRIEAFVLHTPESLSAFEVQHYGNSRMIGIPERFTVTRPETSESFQEDPLPGDRHSSSMLAYRIGSALATRLVTFQNERKDRSITVPFFLEIGLAHALAIDATGKSVYKAGTSEVRATGGNQDEVDEWKSEGWLALMSKLVGTRKDGSSNAPTFDQLTSVKLETANFSHHVSAWSLVTFLRLLPDDGQKKFLQFILQIRSGVDPSGALNAVYGVTGRELTEAWHAWARDSSKQLLAPSSPLIGLGPENVLANYKKVMAEKEGRNKNAADLAQRRLGAIRSLRWGPATEAANELILLLSEKNKSKSKDDKSRRSEDEALAALQTLRAAELARPEVASILNEKLKTSVNKTGDETFQIRLLRSAGTQIGERGLLLPVLQRYLQSPALVASSATHTLGELKDPKSLPALREVAASQSALLRAEAAKAIAEIGPENDLELATKLLGDNSWHVRIAAIEMFKKLRTSEAGDKLIARMPLENGRLLEDIENTLIEMTRPQLLPTSAEDWSEFWYNRGGRDSIASGTAPKSTNSRTQSGADFAGFPPIKSKRFMFMVDVSESMNQPVNIIPKGGTSASSNSRPKIRFITEKLRDLITDPKQIPADVLFDIAFFASNTDLWKGLLVPTEGEGSANRNSAAQFLTFEGRAQVASTDLKRALESAIKLAEESLNKGDRESAIDTIYLLTDGSPTAGKIQDPDQLCEWFREANRNHRIKVFVICIGATDTDMSFLERLSRENYGPKPVVVMKDG